MAPTTRILTVAAIAAGALVGPSASGSTVSASGENSRCGGMVFRDLDADGRRVEALERDGRRDDPDTGVGGVPVKVITIEGDVHRATSMRNGTWSADLTPFDYPIRVEFSVPDGYEAGRPGADAGTTVQFVASPDDCDGHPLGNLGIYPVDDFCASQPEIAVPCHVTADAVSYDEQPAIRAVSNSAVDDGTAGEVGETTIDDWLQPRARTLATHGQIGTVYGQAATRDGTLFASAFTKRHTRLKSTLNPDGNPTVVYRISPGQEPEIFMTLEQDAVDPHGQAGGQVDDDLDAMNAVFTSGIGDIELSPDESLLYLVDLGRRDLVVVDVESAAIVDRFHLDGPALGRADCATSDADRFGDLRPFGLGWSHANLLVGVVCSAASTVRGDVFVEEIGDPGPGAGDHDQLMGYVYRFRSGSFDEVLAWPLAADRGETHSNEKLSNEAIWHPWTATYPFDAEHVAVSYPQPAITDLVLDSRGRLIIAVGDRWSHQTSAETNAPARDGSTRRITETVAAGDLQRACRRANRWEIEGSSGCPGGFGNGWEFFDGDSYGWQAETALGSVARLPGRREVVATQMNPIPEDHAWSSGGLVWHSTDDGGRADGVRLYDRQASAPGSTFENASGLGDLAILCGGPDPSIGGSVWHDVNGDGVRDPGDRPIAGAAIELVDNDGEIVTIDYSDGRGYYAFDRTNVKDGLKTGDSYSLVLGERNFKPERGVLAGLGEFTGLVATARDVGGRDDIDSDAVAETSHDESWIGARIEVRVGYDPAARDHRSPIDHHYDFGLRDRYDLAVSSAPGPAMSEAGMVAFRIEVRNEGSVPSGPVEVRANLPAATSLHDSTPGSVSLASTVDGSITWSFDEANSIAAGDTRVIDLELRVIDPSVESITHTVEIVADSGRDEDSDPGTFWDEDDEARLTVELYDIAGSIWVEVASDQAEPVRQGSGGVVVNILDDGGSIVGRTLTDADGRFLLDSFPEGSYRVAVPASEFESGRPLSDSDRAVGSYSANVTRMLDREGFVSTEPIALGPESGRRPFTAELGLVRQPPTPLVDTVVMVVLLPLILLCVAVLAFERRRHLGGALLPANRL